MLAKFAINNKTYLTTKVSPFMANYRRELRMGIDIRRKGKIEKVTEFAERMKNVIMWLNSDIFLFLFIYFS